MVCTPSRSHDRVVASSGSCLAALSRGSRVPSAPPCRDRRCASTRTRSPSPTRPCTCTRTATPKNAAQARRESRRRSRCGVSRCAGRRSSSASSRGSIPRCRRPTTPRSTRWLRRITGRAAWREPLPPERRVVIPGYADLRALSRARPLIVQKTRRRRLGDLPAPRQLPDVLLLVERPVANRPAPGARWTTCSRTTTSSSPT